MTSSLAAIPRALALVLITATACSVSTHGGRSARLPLQPTPTPLNVRTVDWKSAEVPGEACLTAGRRLRLHAGKVLLPNSHGHPVNGKGARYDELALSGVYAYGDLDGDGRTDAAVGLDCNNNGGTADGAILYSLAVYTSNGGHLHLVGLVTPKRQRKHELPTLLSTVKITKGRIVVQESWYGSHDATCCPTGRATTTWTYAHGQLVAGHPLTTKQPK